MRLARRARRRSSCTADRPADGAVVDALGGAARASSASRRFTAAAGNGGPASRRRGRSACASTSRATRRCSSRRRPPCSPSTASRSQDVKLGAPTPRGRLHPPHRTDAAMSAIAAPTLEPGTQRRAFCAVLLPRPLRHLARVPVFLAQVILQPLFLLFVFGKVLGSARLHAARLHRPALPRPARAHGRDHGACRRSRSRSWSSSAGRRRSRTGCSRRCRPRFVVAEKVLFAVVRSLSRRSIMIPIGILILGSIPWRWAGLPLLRRRARPRQRSSAPASGC